MQLWYVFLLSYAEFVFVFLPVMLTFSSIQKNNAEKAAPTLIFSEFGGILLIENRIMLFWLVL